jgi:hypothetical protein
MAVRKFSPILPSTKMQPAPTLTSCSAERTGYLLLPHNSHCRRGLKPRTRVGGWVLGGGLVTDGEHEEGAGYPGAAFA